MTLAREENPREHWNRRTRDCIVDTERQKLIGKICEIMRNVGFELQFTSKTTRPQSTGLPSGLHNS